MLKEQELFLRILSDFLHCTTTPSIPDADWDLLAKYAVNHQLVGVLYTQCKSSMPSSVKDKLYQNMLSAVVGNQRRKVILQKITDSFHAQDISFFLIKGAVIADYYPVPEFRMMGDVDIVVHSEDRERCHDIMIGHGFKCISHLSSREWAYNLGRIEIELHDHLVYQEDLNEEVQELFFNDYWKYVNNNQLNETFHFLFVLFHLRKHFLNRGVGFRQFLDLSVMIKNGKDIDWKIAEANLRDLRLLPFAKTCFSLIYRWFGIECPIGLIEIEESFYQKATAQIFENGVFGFADKNNQKNLAINHAIKKGGSIKGSLSTLTHAIFPALDVLLSKDHYKYLKKKPFLLPIAWIDRAIRVLHDHKISNTIHMIRNTYASEEDIASRQEQFDFWKI